MRSRFDLSYNETPLQGIVRHGGAMLQVDMSMSQVVVP